MGVSHQTRWHPVLSRTKYWGAGGSAKIKAAMALLHCRVQWIKGRWGTGRNTFPRCYAEFCSSFLLLPVDTRWGKKGLGHHLASALAAPPKPLQPPQMCPSETNLCCDIFKLENILNCWFLAVQLLCFTMVSLDDLKLGLKTWTWTA